MLEVEENYCGRWQFARFLDDERRKDGLACVIRVSTWLLAYVQWTISRHTCSRYSIEPKQRRSARLRILPGSELIAAEQPSTSARKGRSHLLALTLVVASIVRSQPRIHELFLAHLLLSSIHVHNLLITDPSCSSLVELDQACLALNQCFVAFEVVK